MITCLLFVALWLSPTLNAKTTVQVQQSSVPKSDTTKLSTEQSAELAEATRLSAKVVELYKAKKYDEALPIAKHVVDSRERILGQDDGRTAAALINLAELYLAKQNYAEAQKTYERVLSTYEKFFAPNDPNNAMIVDSLALINYLRGNFKEAETFYVRALSMREKGLGADHPDVAQASFELAEFYRSRANYKKAEPLYLRAIEINDQKLPHDNPTAVHVVQRYVCFLYESKGIDEGVKRVHVFNEARRDQSKPAGDRGEVLNGKAISLPTPAYPSEARAVHASGVVIVEVTIDETGNVIDAKAWCRHSILARAALEAAQRARFTPTKLSGKPIKVHGVIIYNFRAF